MTREEAIKILRKEIECLSHTKCENCILESACDPMKTPYDSEYIEIYEMAIKALEQEPKTWHWIPVSERLPEENKSVIVSTKYGVYPEARYTKAYGWEWVYEAGADYWKELKHVTAWTPLPEHYKESEDKG